MSDDDLEIPPRPRERVQCSQVEYAPRRHWPAVETAARDLGLALLLVALILAMSTWLPDPPSGDRPMSIPLIWPR